MDFNLDSTLNMGKILTCTWIQHGNSKLTKQCAERVWCVDVKPTGPITALVRDH